MKKRTPIAVLAAVAALALPVCALADGTPPAQGPGDRVARIQARIQKAETRIGKVTEKITVLQQKLAAKCSVQPTTPAPAAGNGQASTAPSLADRCARAEARLQKAQDRLQQAQDRLTSLSATERARVMKAAKTAEQRARKLREALVAKAAAESADKWTRE